MQLELHFSILSDLKKTTVVVESLSTIQPDVLFQRLPAYFKINSCDVQTSSRYVGHFIAVLDIYQLFWWHELPHNIWVS